MRRWLAAAVLATWSAAWVACSSFEDEPATTAPDASANDAPVSPPLDATNDTTEPLVDAAPDGACTAFFCDGFERTMNLANGWNELTVGKNAALSLSDQHPKSGTGSMQLVMYGDAGTEAGRTAQIVKNLPPGTTRTVLDFWLYYEEPPSSDTTLANITLDDEGNVLVLLRPTGGFVLAEQYRVDGGPVNVDNDVQVGTIRNGVARHITLDMGPTVADGGADGGLPGARITVDEDSRVLPFQSPNVTARPERVWLGAGFSQPKARNEDTFWYDDVVIEAK